MPRMGTREPDRLSNEDKENIIKAFKAAWSNANDGVGNTSGGTVNELLKVWIDEYGGTQYSTLNATRRQTYNDNTHEETRPRVIQNDVFKGKTLEEMLTILRTWNLKEGLWRENLL